MARRASTRDRRPGAARARRPAAETRREILDAAQRRLTQGGPEAVRLQEIAADVGISHPAILHHFGSREGLLQALDARAMAGLQAELMQPLSTGEALDRVFAVLGDQGYARLLAWWVLSNRVPDEGPGPPMMRTLGDGYHAERRAAAAAAREPEPDYEDTAFGLRLAATALMGEALIGPLLTRSAGLDDGAATRFRAWLAQLLSE